MLICTPTTIRQRRRMWPANEKIGPQLTYGISGNGVLNLLESRANSLPSLHFPRLRHHGPHLHLIANSTRQIAPTSLPEEQRNEASIYKSHLGPLKDVAVPENVITSLALEAAPLQDHIGQDPSIGSHLRLVHLGTGAYTDRVLVDGQYVTPKTKTNVLDVEGVVFVAPPGIINVAPILPKRRNLLHSSNPQLLKKTLVDTVALDLAAEYAIPWPIKQVEVCNELRLVAVRGEVQCCFLSFRWSNEPTEKGAKLTKAFEVSNSSSAWSQIVFNSGRFALVHVDGSIDIWLFSQTDGEWDYKMQSKVDPHIYDPLDWSLWKRVCWPIDAEYLVLFCRKSAHFIDLQPLIEETEVVSTVKRLVTTHYWSHLQDVAIAGSYIFLLTSKELIWLETEKQNPLKRLLSWKHYLDDADSSLRLSICALSSSETFLLSVYSRVTPIVITYTFGVLNGKPCSLRDPYVLYTTKNDGIAHMAVGESVLLDSEPAPMMYCFEIGLDAQVNFYNFCGAEDWKFKAREEEVRGNRHTVNFTTEAPKVFTCEELQRIFSHFTSLSAVSNDRKDKIDSSVTERITQKAITDNNGSLINELSSAGQPSASKADDPVDDSDIDSGSPTPEQIDAVQNYAFELGADMRGIFDTDISELQYPQYHSLAAIAQRIPSNVTDLKEFDSMVQQLGEFCDENGGHLELANMGLFERGKGAKKHEPLSADRLASILADLNQSSNIKAAVILVLSLVKAYSVEVESQHKQLIQDELEECSEDLVGIFQEWLAHSPKNQSVEQLNMAGSKVGVTSAHTLHSQKKPKQEKKELLKRALTQSSQAFKLDSQLVPIESEKIDVKIDPSLRLPSSQMSDTLFMSQFASSQESLDGDSPFSSQISLGSQSHSQLGPRKKKKKKGGFA